MKARAWVIFKIQKLNSSFKLEAHHYLMFLRLALFLFVTTSRLFEIVETLRMPIDLATHHL